MWRFAGILAVFVTTLVCLAGATGREVRIGLKDSFLFASQPV
jgi:hypothetical protein